MLLTVRHVRGPWEQRCGAFPCKPVRIGDGARIGAHVTILPGVSIGPGAVIAAGAVVAQDVPPNARFAGNPARVVGWLDRPEGGSIDDNVGPAISRVKCALKAG